MNLPDSDTVPEQQKPEQKDVSHNGKAVYFWGAAGAADSIASTAVSFLAMPIYSIALGVNPTLIGLATGIPRIWDAIADPFIGNLSDNTRSRWGRRRPYIAVGGTMMSLLFLLLWMPPMRMGEYPTFIYFLVVSMVFYTCYAFWSVPYSALGFELTTDCRTRTKVQAIRTFFTILGGLLLPWAYRLSFVFGGDGADGLPKEVHGVRIVALLYGGFIILTALLPVFFCSENLEVQKQKKISLRRAFACTVKNKPFLYVAGTVFFVITACIIVLPVGQYVNIYYVFQGNKEAASTFLALSGTLNTIVGATAVPLIAWCAMRFGKRRVLLVGLSTGCMGFLTYWFLLTPRFPYLQLIAHAITAPGLLCVFILCSSMLADICDYDEMETGLRREGLYSATYAWLYKASLGSSMALGGMLIQWVGVQPELGAAQTPESILWMRILLPVIPAVCFAIAFILIVLCPLRDKRTLEVRAILDQRSAAGLPTKTPASDAAT